jgi:alkylation response protein AidB-like acyl-CoA dehydrogenase
MIDSFIAASGFLQTVHDWLLTHVATRSTQLDTAPDALLDAFKGLGTNGWLALRISQDYGGQGVDAHTYFGFQFLLARYSGTLAFLQTQHQSAAGFIASGSNPHLKASYLADMATGKRRVGIGYSHLRRPVSPLQAIPAEDGYCLTGEIPWITGEGFFDECVVAAQAPNGDAVLGIIPLSEHDPGQKPLLHNDLRGSLVIGDPMPLMVMGVTNTVRMSLSQWWLSPTHLIDVKPSTWLPIRDRQNVIKAASFALGCAQAGIDIITQEINRKGWRSLMPHRDQLQQSVDQCFGACLQRIGDVVQSEPEVADHRQLRAQAVALAGRCSQGAIATVGGAANLRDHPAQRIYRETLMFTVTGQTPDVAHAILNELADPSPSRAPL